MSSHGRSGVSRWLYGSVAEKVLRGAECATMIIRAPSE
jgi:nucleotide-binding universal stress UspA family protein